MNTLFIHLKSLLLFQFMQLAVMAFVAALLLVAAWMIVKHWHFILFYFKKFFVKEFGTLLLAVLFAGVLFAAGRMFMSGLQSRMPHDKIDHTLLRERLFVNVRQDSLQHLAEQRGAAFDAPGIFGSRATITLPLGPSLGAQDLKTELDSLAAVYSREVEVEQADGGSLRLSCPTVRHQGERFVCVPVTVMLHLLSQQQRQSNP